MRADSFVAFDSDAQSLFILNHPIIVRFVCMRRSREREQSFRV
jgi:hypothetical protein